jgi:hypothetical protein
MSFMQVEARLRQLEGHSLGADSAVPRGQQQPQKYKPAGNGALPSQPKAYNADTDVSAPAADAAADGKKKKKVRVAEWGGAPL